MLKEFGDPQNWLISKHSGFMLVWKAPNGKTNGTLQLRVGFGCHTNPVKPIEMQGYEPLPNGAEQLTRSWRPESGQGQALNCKLHKVSWGVMGLS